MIGLVLVLAAVQDSSALGDHAFREGRFAEAAAHYEKALASGKSAALYVNLGHSYSRLDQWEKAIEAYRSALEMKADLADPHRFLGQALFQVGRYSDAAESFRKAESLQPGAGDGLWIARCRVAQGEWIRAEHELVRRLRDRERDVEGRELLAHVFFSTSRPREAANLYRELAWEEPSRPRFFLLLAHSEAAAKRHGEAIDALEIASRVAGPDAEVLRLLADLYLEERMAREAASCYARLMAASKEVKAEDYHRLGHAYFQAREFLSSKEAIGKALKLDPVHLNALMLLGHVELERGDAKAAQLAYEKAAQVSAAPLPNRALAALHLRVGAFEAAAEALDQAIRRGDTEPIVFHDYVVALLQSGKQDRAITTLKEALQAHSSNERLRALVLRLAK